MINFVKEDVKTELEDVSVILAAGLKCIYKLCLSLVKKGKGLRDKLLELDAKIGENTQSELPHFLIFVKFLHIICLVGSP